VAVVSKSTFNISGLMLSRPGAVLNFRFFKTLKISALLGGFVFVSLFSVIFTSSCFQYFLKLNFHFL
jgi:hypothetical protein